MLIAGFKRFDLFSVIIIGIATGFGGGSLRDILSNEPPLVFHSPLYATVSWVGSLLFIGLLYFSIEVTLAAVVLSIFIARLVVLYFNINLPTFRFKS